MSPSGFSQSGISQSGISHSGISQWGVASRAPRSEAYDQNGRCVCDSSVFFFAGVGARGRRPLRIRRPRRTMRGSRRAGRSRRGEKSRKVVLEVVPAAGAGGGGGFRYDSRGCRFCCPGHGFLANGPPGRGSALVGSPASCTSRTLATGAVASTIAPFSAK